MRPCVTGMLFRRITNGGIEIFSQIRLVQNKSYDPLYDQTHETVAGLVEEMNGWPKENILDALLREVVEECGVPGFKPVAIHGVNGQIFWDTGKEDKFLCVEPFCFVQSLGPPQPWIGPVFLVEVGHNFEPNQEKSDGEAGDHQWWSPEDLLEEVLNRPSNIMGNAIGPFEKLCRKAIAGQI